MPRPPPRRTCASSAWNLKQTCFVSSISTAISHMPIRATKTIAAHRILESNLLGLPCLSLPPCTSVFFAQATKKSACRLFTLKILHFPFMLVYGLANHWVDSQLATEQCLSICAGRFHEVTVNRLFFKINHLWVLFELRSLLQHIFAQPWLPTWLTASASPSSRWTWCSLWLESNRGKEVISLDAPLCRQPMQSGL